jgi:hypothetical protein
MREHRRDRGHSGGDSGLVWAVVFAVVMWVALGLFKLFSLKERT